MPELDFFIRSWQKLIDYFARRLEALGQALNYWRRLFWSRRFIKFGFCGALLAVAPATYLAYIAPYLNWNAKNDWARFERAADRARGIALYDSTESYVGIVHSEVEPDHLGGQKTSNVREIGLAPDHKAIPVSDAPKYYWRCLKYLEDRHRGTLRNPHGVDFISTFLIPVKGAGGSTVEMQLARSMWKMSPSSTETIWQTLSRKRWEWGSAPVLNHNLVNRSDERALRVWTAQHLPIVRGAGDNQDVYGVEAAGQFLFGKSADELDPAEQLFLAAAIYSPYRMRDTTRQRIRQLERYLKHKNLKGEIRYGRAYICTQPSSKLQDGPVIPDEIREAVEARQQELLSDDYIVPLPTKFEPALRALYDHPAGPRMAPMRIAKRLVPNVQRAVIAELQDTFGPPDSVNEQEKKAHPWRGKVWRIDLTLDAAQNFAFREKIKGAIFDFDDPRIRDGAFPKKTVAPDGTVDITTGDTPIIIVAADERGRIVRYYNSFTDTVYSGRTAQRPNIPGYGDGSYNVQLELRTIASIGKMAAAILLASHDVTGSNTMVSNVCLKGFTQRCASGNKSRYPYQVSWKRAFGASLNSPIVRKLAATVSRDKIDSFMTAHGFFLQDSHKMNNAATNVVVGRYSGRPKSVHLLAASALTYVKGDTTKVFEPHFIERAYGYDSKKEKRVDEPVKIEQKSLDLADLITPDNRGFLKAVLSEPLCNRQYGSLRKLYRWCAVANRDVKIHVAKTGTGPSGGDVWDESDWWIAGGIEFADGRTYSYIASAGSGSPSEAFADNLGGDELSPLVEILLYDLLEAD